MACRQTDRQTDNMQTSIQTDDIQTDRQHADKQAGCRQTSISYSSGLILEVSLAHLTSGLIRVSLSCVR